MPKQVLLLQKNPARPDVMPLANGNNVFTIAFLMGQFLPPPPSQGDYISSMRTLNKHTEPPFCNFLQWILPCDSHMPPILSAPILSAPILSYLSANSAAYLNTPFSDYTHLQPYLKLYLSILILYLPISKLSAYNSYLSLLLCPSLPQSLPSYFSVLVILPKLQCPPLFSPYDNFKSRKNSAQKPNYSLEQ